MRLIRKIFSSTDMFYTKQPVFSEPQAVNFFVSAPVYCEALEDPDDH